MAITLGTVAQTPIFTPARLACFKRMQAEQHQLWTSQVQPQVDDSNVKTPSVYGELGLGAVIDWMLTGDKTKASLAADILIASETDGYADRNWERGYVMQAVLTTYWIWSGISTDQQTALFNMLQNMVNIFCGVGTANYTGGFRVSDTDQTVGQFGGIILCQLLFPDVVVPATSGGGGNTAYLIGGLDSTADDQSSVRNAVREMVDKFARGGELYVSSGYNFGDDAFLLLMLWLSCKHIKGADHFPEIAAWAQEWAVVLIHDVTPDLADRAHWGDDQTSDVAWWDYATALCIAACCLEDAGAGHADWLRFRFNEVLAKLGDVYPNRISPQAVLWFDPYAVANDYRPGIPRTVDCSAGVGQVTRHDGWLPTSPFFWWMSPNDNGVDHQCDFVGSIQVYDNKIWPIDDPIAYGPTKDSPALNAPLYCGCSSMEFFGAVAVVDLDKLLVCVGATSGQPEQVGGYDLPPLFVHEGLRATVYLPELKAVVVIDRMNLDDPRKADAATLADELKYHPDFIANINGAGSLKEVLWHSPIPAPVTSPVGASWQIKDGSTVRLDCFSTGGDLTVAVDNEDTIWGVSGQTWNAANKGSSRIRFGSDRTGLECIITVLQWGPNQVVPTPVSSADVAGFAIGGCQVLFGVATAALPTVTAGPLTNYLIGTDSSGAWSVTTQEPVAPVVPTPQPTPAPAPADIVVPAGAIINVNGQRLKVQQETQVITTLLPV